MKARLPEVPDLAVRHPRLTAALAAALAIVSLWPLAGTRVNNSLEVWLVRDTQAYRDYRRFVEAFGSEEYILVALHGEGMHQRDGLELVREATARAASLRGVLSVLSPSVIQDKLHLGDEVAQKFIRSVPTYRGLLMSADGRTAGLLLNVDPGASSRRQLVGHLREALSFVRARGVELHLGGPPVLNAELDRLSSGDPRVLFPVVLAVTVVLLAALFRSPGGVLVPLAVLLVTVLVSLAGVVILGRQLNMITVGFPSVLWVLVIGQSVHLLSAYARQREAGIHGARAVKAAVGQIAYPCFLMSLTTAAGFLSLLFSSVGPVRELAVYTAAGILLGFLVNLFLAPSLLLLRGREGAALVIRVPPERGTFERLVSWIRQHRAATLLAASVVVAASVSSAARIEVETNALRFLRSGHPLLEDYAFIQEHLAGLSSLEIDLEREAAVPLEVVLEKIDRFAGQVRSMDPAIRVLSIDDFLKAAAFFSSTGSATIAEVNLEELHQQALAFFQASLPPSRALLLPLLRLAADPSAYITDDNRRLRVSVFSRAFEGSEFEGLKRDVEDAAGEVFQDSARVTGIVPLLVSMQEYLLVSQVKCLAAALGIIFVFMILAARSLGRALLCMIPNVFPIVVSFGIMGLLGVRLDAATTMIASVGIGIAVDSTIHLIVAFREFGMRREEGILERTIAWKGRAIVYTTVITCLGFSVLALSNFLPMAWFGALTALTILFAMLGDLLLLPALLSFLREGKS